jgi:hypothetical protein
MSLIERIVIAESTITGPGRGAGFMQARGSSVYFAVTPTKISLTTKVGPRKRIKQEDFEMTARLFSALVLCYS